MADPFEPLRAEFRGDRRTTTSTVIFPPHRLVVCGEELTHALTRAALEAWGV